MAPERVCVIVGACAVLHNIAILLNEPMDEGTDGDTVDFEPYQGAHQRSGHTLRNHIRDTYFA